MTKSILIRLMLCCAFTVASAGLTIAQNKTFFTESFINHSKTIDNQMQPVQNNSKVLQAPPFFSEDFAGGIPAGWTNADNAGTGVVWVVTTTGAYNTGLVVDEQLNPSGTSAANGYLKIDSDSAGFGVAQNAAITTVAINCTGHSTVRLGFNEYFAQYGVSTGTVAVSNNNVTWTNVYSAETGLVQDSGTANPNAIDIDISTIAANQASVYIRFTYVGNFDYWWFVDDVQLYEPSAIDLAATAIDRLNDEYTQIPVSQSNALARSANVKNTGLNATTGGTALYEILNATTSAQVFSETINLGTAPPGIVQAIISMQPFIAPYEGLFKSKITITLAGDGNPANDTLSSLPIAISDSVYARDDGDYQDVMSVGAGAGEDGIAGQNFYVNATDDITSITFFLRDTLALSPTGTPIFFSIHPQLNDTTAPGIALATTDTLMVTNAMIPAGGAFFTLEISGGALNVAPGLYFIGFHELDVMLPVGYSLANYTPNSVWVHWNSNPLPSAVNGWSRAEDFGFNLTYMIRANFGSTGVGLNENTPANTVEVYPNPSAGNFNLSFKNPSINYTVQVWNEAGQLAYKTESRNQESISIDISALSKGIYTLLVNANGNIVAKKLVIGE